MQDLCMGCMERLDNKAEKCPHCGYTARTTPGRYMEMEPGSMLLGRFVVGRMLDYGNRYILYVGWDIQLKRKVLVKEYFPCVSVTRLPGGTQVVACSDGRREQIREGVTCFVSETSAVIKMRNLGVYLEIYEVFEENGTAYIVMEYAEETLERYLDKNKMIPLEQAIEMISPLIRGLIRLHKTGNIHGSISPQTVFVTANNKLKLSYPSQDVFDDVFSEESLACAKWSGFLPGEIFQKDIPAGPYTDVYAVAALLYKMITGESPADVLERIDYAANRRIEILSPVSAYCSTISRNQENAILNAMNPGIQDRYASMAAFYEALTNEKIVLRRWGNVNRLKTTWWHLTQK